MTQEATPGDTNNGKPTVETLKARWLIAAHEVQVAYDATDSQCLTAAERKEAWRVYNLKLTHEGVEAGKLAVAWSAANEAVVPAPPSTEVRRAA